MKKEFTKYYCDICEKEVAGIEDLNSISLPIRHLKTTDYQGFGKWEEKPRIRALEICDNCLEDIHKAISANFANIYSQDYVSGITVVFKKEAKDEDS